MADKGLAADAEIQAALAELPGWKRQNNSLQKTFDLKGFKAAMAFAGTVGELADRADHHPDILIQFHKVTIRSEEHTSELQSRQYLVCRLLLEKKKKKT